MGEGKSMDSKNDTKSVTEEETWAHEHLLDLGSHYKTTISDGSYREVTGIGNTSEESQKVASEKWDSLNKKE